MKNSLVRLFWPILKFFENDLPAVNYKKSHRVILIVVGALFLVLATVSGLSASQTTELSGFIPVIVFFLVGMVAIVVGSLGSDSAVANIWGRR